MPIDADRSAVTNATPSPGSPLMGRTLGLGAFAVGIGFLAATPVLMTTAGFKPAVIIVFGPPALLWFGVGALLISRRERALPVLRGLLFLQIVIGSFAAFQATSLANGHDARFLGGVGLALILVAVVFLVPTAVLAWRVRRLTGRRP